MSRSDRAHMERALALAARGAGVTHPNPRVGAVLVREGKVVGEGWHRGPGHPHAEAVALARAGSRARGATLFVNLEPCSHFGRTPPCADALVAAGVRRVVASHRDPNPLVDGKGARRLRRAGVRVEFGLLAGEARELNRAYLSLVSRGLPHLTLKLAQSLDGRIAAPGGGPRWITGAAARGQVHRLRAGADAVMIGVGTVLADDPALTARPGGRPARRQPVRVVLDPTLRTPLGSRVVREAADGLTLLVVAREVSPRRRAPFSARGVRFLPLSARAGRFSWRAVGRGLARMGLLEVLAEGGGETARWLLQEGAVDRLELFLAPLIIGGEGVASFAPFQRLGSPRGAARLRLLGVGRPGRDLRVTLAPER